MKPYAQVLFYWLCEHANEKNSCFPSRTTLAKESGMSVDMVDKMLKVLCEEGLVEKEERLEGNEQQTNKYYVLIAPSRQQRRPPADSNGTELKPLLTQLVNTNVLTSEQGSQGKAVNEVIGFFKLINPSFDKFYRNKTQRQAVERLLKKWTAPQIKAVVQGILPKINADKYAKGKSITPLQLEENLGYIKAYVEQKQKLTNILKV